MIVHFRRSLWVIAWLLCLLWRFLVFSSLLYEISVLRCRAPPFIRPPNDVEAAPTLLTPLEASCAQIQRQKIYKKWDTIILLAVEPADHSRIRPTMLRISFEFQPYHRLYDGIAKIREIPASPDSGQTRSRLTMCVWQSYGLCIRTFQ